jgi:hypothetical protein
MKHKIVVTSVFYDGFNDVTYYPSLEEICMYCFLLELNGIKYILKAENKMQINVLLKEKRKKWIDSYKPDTQVDIQKKLKELNVSEAEYWLL